MTTLERINKAIAHCEKEVLYWEEKGNLKLRDYYQGRVDAYKHIEGLIECDKDFNNYSF